MRQRRLRRKRVWPTPGFETVMPPIPMPESLHNRRVPQAEVGFSLLELLLALGLGGALAAVMLQLLLQANAVVERQALLAAVWGDDFYGDANVLDVYIRYLRQKLEFQGQPTLIQTVRGVGYMLKPGAIKP